MKRSEYDIMLAKMYGDTNRRTNSFGYTFHGYEPYRYTRSIMDRRMRKMYSGNRYMTSTFGYNNRVGIGVSTNDYNKRSTGDMDMFSMYGTRNVNATYSFGYSRNIDHVGIGASFV